MGSAAKRRSGTMSRMAGAVSGVAIGVIVAMSSTIVSARADAPVRIAVLATYFQNDHAAWVPTTDAELRRLTDTANTFQQELQASGSYDFTAVTPSLRDVIDKGQQLGACAGCEVAYGKELGVEQVAWIEVQKISELILNINVYIADVNSGQMVFGKSVDLRGNTDESWHHAITYLVKNYLLADR